MLIGLGVFALDDLGVFQTQNSIGTTQNITLTNGVYDEFHLQNVYTSTFASTLDNWTSSTLLLAKFQDNLSAGNIDIGGLTIETLKIKKRKIDTLVWEDVAEIIFSSDTSTYTHNDRLVESSEEYEYVIQPCTSSVEGDYSAITSIDVLFEGAFLFDADYNYRLFYNFELGDVITNIPNSTVEFLGAKYPIVLYSAITDYKSGSIRAMLISDATVSANAIDIKAEKVYRKALMEFLNNKQPKLLKSMDGNYMLISITSTPKLSPVNSLNAFVYDLSFDFVEINDASDYDILVENGIV